MADEAVFKDLQSRMGPDMSVASMRPFLKNLRGLKINEPVGGKRPRGRRVLGRKLVDRAVMAGDDRRRALADAACRRRANDVVVEPQVAGIGWKPQ